MNSKIPTWVSATSEDSERRMVVNTDKLFFAEEGDGFVALFMEPDRHLRILGTLESNGISLFDFGEIEGEGLDRLMAAVAEKAGGMTWPDVARYAEVSLVTLISLAEGRRDFTRREKNEALARLCYWAGLKGSDFAGTQEPSTRFQSPIDRGCSFCGSGNVDRNVDGQYECGICDRVSPGGEQKEQADLTKD